MTHGDGGKGSQQRPTDQDKFAENFEKIFGRKAPADVSQEVVNQVTDAVNLASDPSFFKERTNERK